MRDYFKFPINSTIGVNAKKCSKISLSWYKSLQFYCSSYFYCNLNLSQGKQLDSRNQENVDKINGLMSECNVSSLPIGAEGALCPNVDDLSRILFYERVLKCGRDYDIETFKYLVDMCEESWIDLIEWDADGQPDGVRPSVPKFYNKDYINFRVGRASIRIKNQQVSVQQGNDSFYFRVKNDNIIPNWVEVKFRTDSVHIIFDYTLAADAKDIRAKLKPDNGIYIGCDVGLNNIVTMVNNVGIKPLAINGGLLKSYNRTYNMQIQKVFAKEGLTDAQKKEKVKSMEVRRNSKLDKVFSGACCKIVAYALQCNATEVILGYTDNLFSKEGIKGFDNADDFVVIPFNRFFNKLKRYLNDAGIRLTFVKDYNTSITSFFDGEPAEEKYNTPEHRISRALFETKDGLIVNVDVNAAYQILVTTKPNCIKEFVRVYLHPNKVNPIEIKVKKVK